MSVINKVRIVAAGRGRSMSLSPIVEAVKALVKSRKTPGEIHLVYLGTASYDKEDAFHAQTYAYESFCKITKLDVSDAASRLPTPDEVSEAISSADILMVSGGNTQYAMKRWQDLGVDEVINNAVHGATPPILCGGSAGAICWFKFGHSDSMDPTTFLNVDPDLTEEEKKNWEYARVRGLGYIPALCVPHHDTTQTNGLPRSHDSDAMLGMYPDQPCVGLEEGAALVVCDGFARVVSGNGTAKCWIKLVNSCNVIESIAFTPDDGKILLAKMLLGIIHRDSFDET